MLWLILYAQLHFRGQEHRSKTFKVSRISDRDFTKEYIDESDDPNSTSLLLGNLAPQVTLRIINFIHRV